MSTMFKIGSFEEEIYKTMQKELVSSQLENKFSLNKLSKATDYINTAAEILDNTGFKVEADMLTKVLKRLAHEHDSDEHKEVDEVIIDPLEQHIEVVPVEIISESPESHHLEFNDIANKLAANFAKKKV